MDPDEVLRCFRCCQSKCMRPCHRRRPPSKTLLSAVKTAGLTMNICHLFLMIFFVFSQGSLVECITINKLDVPQSIVNGSKPVIIFDCDFEYTEKDLDGLVIQWFYNNSAAPIYQWIPPSRPQAQGAFVNRLDLDHKISDDPNTQHRALRILSPTVELSGNYRCLVSSFKSEDDENRTFTVYAPAHRLDINVTKASDSSVNVTCIAEGAYPEPLNSLLIYKDDKEPEPVDNFYVTSRDDDGDGHTDVIGYGVFEDQYLASRKVIFECVWVIPESEYREVKKSDTYHPDIPVGACGLVSSSRLLTVTTAILSIISTTFMFLRYDTFRCQLT